MLEATVPVLLSWENFYVVIGSASAALTGLMFVVITLTTSFRRQRTGDPFAAYSTPNVVHFCAALYIAAVLSAPWPVLWSVGLLLGLWGIGGLIYAIIVARRLRRTQSYEPVLEDWLWNAILPFLSYSALVIASVLLLSHPEIAFFIIGAASVLLLFIGIHNAWDIVTYVAVTFGGRDDKSQNE